MSIEFKPFPKIARLRREVVITEKIDGTNAGILVPEDGGPLVAAKRSGFIAPGPTDNVWFAAWVAEHEAELRGLGPGMHFGEWWGERINKRYPTVTGRRFSLFNTERWRDANPVHHSGYESHDTVPAPNCCSVVPVLLRSPRLDDREIAGVLDMLRSQGSRVAPGCKAEGIVVYHTAARVAFKVTCEKDDEPKGKEPAQVTVHGGHVQVGDHNQQTIKGGS